MKKKKLLDYLDKRIKGKEKYLRDSRKDVEYHATADQADKYTNSNIMFLQHHVRCIDQASKELWTLRSIRDDIITGAYKEDE